MLSMSAPSLCFLEWHKISFISCRKCKIIGKIRSVAFFLFTVCNLLFIIQHISLRHRIEKRRKLPHKSVRVFDTQRRDASQNSQQRNQFDLSRNLYQGAHEARSPTNRRNQANLHDTKLEGNHLQALLVRH